MWFAIWAIDKADSSELRLTHRQAHRSRLEDLMHQGRLFCAGPMPDPQGGAYGSLMILEFEDLAKAQEWAEQDPYYCHGLYQRLEIKPWQPVFTSDHGI